MRIILFTLLILLNVSCKSSEPAVNNINLLGVTITVYNPVIEQTNCNPIKTASGMIIDTTRTNELRWCAVSRNLLKRWGGHLQYGDSIFIMSNNSNINGWWYVYDTMNERYYNYIDLLQCKENGLFGKWTGYISSNELLWTD